MRRRSRGVGRSKSRSIVTTPRTASARALASHSALIDALSLFFKEMCLWGVCLAAVCGWVLGQDASTPPQSTVHAAESTRHPPPRLFPSGSTLSTRQSAGAARVCYRDPSLGYPQRRQAQVWGALVLALPRPSRGQRGPILRRRILIRESSGRDGVRWHDRLGISDALSPRLGIHGPLSVTKTGRDASSASHVGASLHRARMAAAQRQCARPVLARPGRMAASSCPAMPGDAVRGQRSRSRRRRLVKRCDVRRACTPVAGTPRPGPVQAPEYLAGVQKSHVSPARAALLLFPLTHSQRVAKLSRGYIVLSQADIIFCPGPSQSFVRQHTLSSPPQPSSLFSSLSRPSITQPARDQQTSNTVPRLPSPPLRVSYGVAL